MLINTESRIIIQNPTLAQERTQNSTISQEIRSEYFEKGETATLIS